MLAAAGPLTRGVTAQWAPVAVGLVTSAVAFAATVLFARWDRIGRADAGATVEAGTWRRVAIGVLIGLTLAGLQSAAIASTGHMRWGRTGNVGFQEAGIALLSYLALACGEELAFHGYPLRRLDGCFGALTAQMSIALVFGLEHIAGGSNWMNAMPGATAGSLLFGMAASGQHSPTPDSTKVWSGRE